MRLILFTKSLQDLSIDDLACRGRDLGLDGFDLCVRPGYAVGPDSLDDLSRAVQTLRAAGLHVPLVTAPGDLVSPEDARAEPYVRALAAAGVPLLKLGYFHWDARADYWAEVERVRALFRGWEALAARHGVTVLYHTHSDDLGSSAGTLAHLIRGLDPRHVAGYLDPGHLLLGGEPFPRAAAVAAEQLRCVAVKDVRWAERRFVPAGQGDVDWDGVFATLAGRGYSGPVSVHAEYEPPAGADAAALLAAEVRFFRERLRAATAARGQSG